MLEDGKPQKISVFEYQRISSKPEPPKELTLDDQFALPEAPKTTITSSTPGQIQYHDKRLMVFFFDFSSMQVPDQLRAQDGALEYLKKNITKDDVVAVLFYASAIQVLSDFTSDRDVLTRVIKGMPIGEASELAALADTGDENGEDTQAAFVADETEFNIFSTDKKLAAIEQAAKMLASFPEKKALVYFSGGVSRNGLDNEAQLQAAINAATKANLAIYAIDTRGLTADPPGGGASKGGSRGAGIFNGSVVQFAAVQPTGVAGYAVHAGGGDRRQELLRQQRHRAGHPAHAGRDGQLLPAGLLQHQQRGGRQVPQDFGEVEQPETGGQAGASRRLLRGQGLGQAERAG